MKILLLKKYRKKLLFTVKLHSFRFILDNKQIIIKINKIEELNNEFKI